MACRQVEEVIGVPVEAHKRTQTGKSIGTNVAKILAKRNLTALKTTKTLPIGRGHQYLPN